MEGQMTVQIIKVIDFETTDVTPQADPIELGWQNIVDFGDGWRLGTRDSRFLYSDKPVAPEARAVHHISDAMIGDGCSLDEAWRKAHLRHGPVTAYAAHNAAFELQFLPGALLGDVPMICTMKCAMRAWPDAPAFGNQVLRYWLGIDVPPKDLELANASHQAEADAYITAHLLIRLLQGHALAQLVEWSQEPKLYPRLTFGKHKGLPWADVPSDYLDWMVYKAGANEMSDWSDWQAAARREISRRYDPENRRG